MAGREDAIRRVEVGFAGGQVMPLRITASEYAALEKALRGEGGGGRWHTVSGDDAEVLVDLAQVQYLRLGADESRIGF